MVPEYDEETPRMTELEDFYLHLAESKEKRDEKIHPSTPLEIFRKYYRPKPPPRSLTA